MTALDAYDRLEAVGILKRPGEDKDKEVVVTFGKASLTMNALSGGGDTPITHWSLAAVDLIKETDTKAVYGISAMAEEVLEIEDATFRRAIAKVLQDRKRTSEVRQSSKKLWFLGALIILLGIGYTFLPGLIANVAKSMISPERAEVLAAEMMPMIVERTGPACDKASGLMALKTLGDRLNPNGNTSLHVHDLGDAHVISLPGGRVLINRAVIETTNQDMITAWAAIGIASVIESPAISELFEGRGVWDGLKFLSSGALSQEQQEKAVNRLLTQSEPVSPVILTNAEQLLANAKLSVAGIVALRDVEQSAVTPSDEAPVMSARDWTDLQNICSG